MNVKKELHLCMTKIRAAKFTPRSIFWASPISTQSTTQLITGTVVQPKGNFLWTSQGCFPASYALLLPNLCVEKAACHRKVGKDQQGQVRWQTEQSPTSHRDKRKIHIWENKIKTSATRTQQTSLMLCAQVALWKYTTSGSKEQFAFQPQPLHGYCDSATAWRELITRKWSVNNHLKNNHWWGKHLAWEALGIHSPKNTHLLGQAAVQAFGVSVGFTDHAPTKSRDFT